MNEIITSILSAEKYAEELLKQASLKSRDISKKNLSECDSIKENAIEEFKEIKKEKIISAEQKAEKEYEIIFQDGVARAESIIKIASPKTDKVVAETVKSIIG